MNPLDKSATTSNNSEIGDNSFPWYIRSNSARATYPYKSGLRRPSCRRAADFEYLACHDGHHLHVHRLGYIRNLPPSPPSPPPARAEATANTDLTLVAHNPQVRRLGRDHLLVAEQTHLCPQRILGWAQHHTKSPVIGERGLALERVYLGGWGVG